MPDPQLMLKIKDMPPQERPRERIMAHGPKALSNGELLAIVLGSGSKNKNVLDISQRMFAGDNIKSLSRKGVSYLKKNSGIGEAKACQIMACFELGRRLAAFKEQPRTAVNNAREVFRIFAAEMSSLKKEHFKGIFLDTRKRIIKEETIFIGSLNASIIHPREIFQIAMEEGAAAVILLHNHPSGDPTPSDDDAEITKQLCEAGKIMGIDVLDHVIIGNNSYFSFMDSDRF